MCGFFSKGSLPNKNIDAHEYIRIECLTSLKCLHIFQYILPAVREVRVRILVQLSEPREVCTYLYTYFGQSVIFWIITDPEIFVHDTNSV